MKVRKNPIVVEARQLTRKSAPDLVAWSGCTWVDLYDRGVRGEDVSFAVIDTPEGRMRADLGDWIIKGIKSEFYPCKPEIFEATYEQVAE